MIDQNYYDGLIAEWYDEWLKDQQDDVNYYAGLLSGFPGQVLELACGTGRILIPIARQGVVIDGLDSSADMLRRLTSKAKNEHLSITTYRQSMSNFELPISYDAIFVSSGSFQLLITEEEVACCLNSVKKHLNPGGFFLMDVFIPWEKIRANSSTTDSITRDNKRSDGSRCIVSERFNVDNEKQLVNSVFRYEVFANNALEQSVLSDFPLRWYWKDELANVLRNVGFSKVELLVDSPLYKPESCFVFKAS